MLQGDGGTKVLEDYVGNREKVLEAGHQGFHLPGLGLWFYPVYLRELLKEFL